MKNFKFYLNESKKIYEFKIKLAGDFESCCVKDIRSALTRFEVNSVSDLRRTPIQESPYEFPDHKNTNVSTLDLSLNYPANPVQIRELISETLGIPLANIKVRTLKEHEEELLNHKYDEKPTETKLTKSYTGEEISAQDQVGETRISDLMKELANSKDGMTEYTIKKLESPKNKPFKIGPARARSKKEK